ncbi:class I SAM-dependent methyltransferase [Oceanihabitans sp. 2_MG-2023]|uniref:class I SAM-dependent methyltransferase n=1 Tax=Oceanihabitans sp. 2_MG-2023 TaxID=3062661 RepID=UPI0026E21EAD|nr:class I SAM-dependent methyltransferase [Oceanihabitans sp. 2_MG-2023]MDO6597580.1 class I SAM-dependent methyltransferase [Oceanihabitans sp. 2_MG-2023]
MEKASLKRLLRNIGVIRVSDNFRYQIMKIRNKKENNSFLKDNPSIKLPPDYLLYESHLLNYREYIKNGIADAQKLKNIFEKHIDLKGKKILDWGCGPARILRHFPDLLPEAQFYGTDYNEKSIAWNKRNIENVQFQKNLINPPTGFKENTFDAIYGLSIFTHLSEENHTKWIDELYRISNKNAVLIITTHGEAFKEKLIQKDQLKFEANQLVIQANTLEGHRTFAAYHPPILMRKMFKSKFEILEHILGEKEDWGISQDTWVIKKL